MLFFTHLDYLHSDLYNGGALEQETSSHHTRTAFCKLFTKVERLIWKIHTNKAIQLPKLSDSEVFSVQYLTAEQTNIPFSPQVTQFRSDKAADLEIYALNPNLILNPCTLHRG